MLAIGSDTFPGRSQRLVVLQHGVDCRPSPTCAHLVRADVIL